MHQNGEDYILAMEQGLLAEKMAIDSRKDHP